MTSILGVSALFHDAAAALVVDGEVVAAAEEERFTRVKHDPSFPKLAIEFCLEQGGLRAEDIDYFGYYEKPLRTFERLLETHLAFAPAGFRSFLASMPGFLEQKGNLVALFRKEFPHLQRRRILFVEHHEAHAASAFFPSPFEDAAILTVDAVGEWACTTLGQGRGRQLSLSHEQRFPHSLGLLYSSFTHQAGFKVNSGEYKLMGLAPHGEPRFVAKILDELVDLKDDGSFRLNLSYFNYCQGLTMTNRAFHRLFEGPPRVPETEITQREMDLAASIQRVTETILMNTAAFLFEQGQTKNLCMAGGVALNCVANGRLLREGPFEEIWIQPAAGDSGGALGTALFLWHQLFGRERQGRKRDGQGASLLGPSFSEEEVRELLDEEGLSYHSYEDEGVLCTRVAELLNEQKLLGWFQGRMEYGPRALGCRSILADPRNPAHKDEINRRIKQRESFRPFAPSVLLEHVGEWFDLEEGVESPFMLLVCPTRNPDPDRPRLPAITHVDGSARVQTVDSNSNPRYYRLLQSFRDETGCPVLLNTSFNVRGEPIVCTPRDALRCFLTTGLDALVLEKNIVLQEEITQQQRDAILAG